MASEPFIETVTAASGAAASSVTAADAGRWSFIDSVRGVAIAGILFVNMPDMLHLGYGAAPGSGRPEGAIAFDFLIQTRFVPIFTFLFGVSMFFVLRGALRRGRRAWLAVGIRMVGLFGIGLLHGLVYPGEVLREYAISGLFVLPLVIFLPRLAQLVVAVALVVGAYSLTGGGTFTLPGLMLLGAAMAAYGLPRALENRSRAVVISFWAATILLIPALWWQSVSPGDPRFVAAGGVAGVIMAAWYVTGLSMLWRTPARRVIAVAFDPLGRMALSNYVGASLIVFAVGRFADFTRVDTLLPVVALAVAILTLQSLASRLWLRSFRYGPLEWLWRMVTWRELMPLRR
jgi:uncharacterized membrane protein YeiB